MKQHPKRGNLHPSNLTDWSNWLSKNHACNEGVWLTVRRKNSAKEGILLSQAVEEALRFGWIDSKLHTQDQDYYRLQFTPRKADSTWSQANKETVERLIKEGKMTEAGLAKVRAAKQNGSWDKLSDVDALKIPEDLQNAFFKDRSAKDNYEQLASSMKKQILWWIASAKLPETRAKRVKLTVEKLQSRKRNPFS